MAERRVGKSLTSLISLTGPALARVAPLHWQTGADRLLTRGPVADWPPRSWERMQAALLDFMPAWAPLAAELGWTAIDLFGCHPEAPFARLDMQGLAIGLHDTRVIALSGTRAAVKRATALHGHEMGWYRRHPVVLAGAVPLWEVGQDETRVSQSTERKGATGKVSPIGDMPKGAGNVSPMGDMGPGR